MKTKYNLEYKQLDGYRVVDAVDVASYQTPILINSTTTSDISLDISKTNFFVIDIQPSSLSETEEQINVEFINTQNGDIFKILVIEPYAIRNLNFDNKQNVLFRDEESNFTDPQEVGRRREQLISFKRTDRGSEEYFSGLATPWFESTILEIIIEFNVLDQNSEPINDATVEVWPQGSASFFKETETTNEDGFCEFFKPRGLNYSYRAIKGGVTGTTHTITSTQTETEEFIEIDIELTI